MDDGLLVAAPQRRAPKPVVDGLSRWLATEARDGGPAAARQERAGARLHQLGCWQGSKPAHDICELQQRAMPPINSPQDVFAAIASIWTAIREGHLTPDEASALSVVMERSIQAIALHDITKRLDALEQARFKRDDDNENNPTAT